MTGGRLKIKKIVNGEDFMVTYGDGLANIIFQKTSELSPKTQKNSLSYSSQTFIKIWYTRY